MYFCLCNVIIIIILPCSQKKTIGDEGGKSNMKQTKVTLNINKLLHKYTLLYNIIHI